MHITGKSVPTSLQTKQTKRVALLHFASDLPEVIQRLLPVLCLNHSISHTYSHLNRFDKTIPTSSVAEVLATEILFSILLRTTWSNPCMFKSTFYLCRMSTMESRDIAPSIYHIIETAHPPNCTKKAGCGVYFI